MPRRPSIRRLKHNIQTTTTTHINKHSVDDICDSSYVIYLHSIHLLVLIYSLFFFSYGATKLTESITSIQPPLSVWLSSSFLFFLLFYFFYIVSIYICRTMQGVSLVGAPCS